MRAMGMGGGRRRRKRQQRTMWPTVLSTDGPTCVRAIHSYSPQLQLFSYLGDKKKNSISVIVRLLIPFRLLLSLPALNEPLGLTNVLQPQRSQECQPYPPGQALNIHRWKRKENSGLDGNKEKNGRGRVAGWVDGWV